MDFSHLAEPALTASVDVLAFVVFGEPAKDPTWKLVDGATKGGLSAAAKGESFDGKSGQSIIFWAGGATTAKRILVLGGGARSELQLAQLRDVGAIAAQQASKVGAESLALVVPSLGTTREAAALQMIMEGALLGTYKFARYLTGTD